MEKLIEKVIKYLESSEAFLKGQVPDFCKQLIEYHTWDTQWMFYVSFAGMSLFFGMMMIFFLCSIFRQKAPEEMIVGGALTGIVFIIAALITGGNYRDLKELELAPKVFLLKEVRKIAR